MKRLVRHFCSTITGDLQSMNSKQFLNATQEHNKNITNKSVTNILFDLLEK